MITFKNSELSPALMQLMAFDSKTGSVVSGLLTEKLTLGTKRKLQKIQTKLLDHYKEYVKHIEEIDKECADDAEKKEAEIKTLNDEEVKADVDFVDIKFIESIETESNYDFSLIEKFAK